MFALIIDLLGRALYAGLKWRRENPKQYASYCRAIAVHHAMMALHWKDVNRPGLEATAYRLTKAWNKRARKWDRRYEQLHS